MRLLGQKHKLLTIWYGQFCCLLGSHVAPIIEREITWKINNHCGDTLGTLAGQPLVLWEYAFDAVIQPLTGETFVILLVPATPRSIQLPSLLQNLSKFKSPLGKQSHSPTPHHTERGTLLLLVKVIQSQPVTYSYVHPASDFLKQMSRAA